MVPFAGYSMPVQYPTGIVKEHLHTRAQAGLFDVSHMGQAHLIGPDHETVSTALEALVPAEIQGLERGQQRYTQLTNANGGILDDLMVTRLEDTEGTLFLVVNAACKQSDYDWIRENVPHGIHLEEDPDSALLALQGPMSEAVLAALIPGVEAMQFMQAKAFEYDGAEVHVSRSGYTGEDGYEISVPNAKAEGLARAILYDDRAMLIGLGARDSLRLEAGLCLYGHDIDETTSPVEAGLLWSIGKRRREEGGFFGAERILGEIGQPKRRRVGIKPGSRAPAREGTEITTPEGDTIGIVTSGGFGPSVEGPVSMGYVASEHAAPGTEVNLIIRGKPQPAQIVRMPFHPHNFKR